MSNKHTTEDKRKLELMLRAFKSGHIDLKYAIDFILYVFRSSKMFNQNSFFIGVFVGLIISLIYIHFSL